MKFLDYLIKISLDFREFAGNFLGPALPWLYTISIALSLLFIWGIVYSIIRSGYMNYQIDYYSDYLGLGTVGRRRQLRVWKQILKRVSSNDASQLKLAVLEADKIMDEIFKMSGYRGDTVDDRFGQVSAEVLPNIDQVREAHKVRDRIAREPDFTITQQEAKEVLKIYQQAFRALGLLE